MCNVIKCNFKRQPVFTAADGEVFASDGERRDYDIKLKLIGGLRNFYTNYGLCPSVIEPIVQVSAENAQFLSNLLGSIAEEGSQA